MRARVADVAPFVEMALGALHREYPYHYSILLRGDEDLALPRTRTPAFRGAFDWHSAVHGHWALVRCLRCFPDAPFAMRARGAVAANLTDERLAAEAAFVGAPGREGFERPYGLAWLLQLAAELREWRDDGAAQWSRSLAPLEAIAVSRFQQWIPKLPWPIRSGEHAQTAFAFSLVHDWAVVARQPGFGALVAQRALDFFAGDVDAPIRYEPSGHDFLSPLLAEADLLRRVMDRATFAAWLERFLPDPENEAMSRWLSPVRSPDKVDGKLAHLDGLNLSRAWMLDGILSALDERHPLRAPFADAAERHRQQAIAGARSTKYAGTHWLGSFAVYLLTERGVR